MRIDFIELKLTMYYSCSSSYDKSDIVVDGKS